MVAINFHIRQRIVAINTQTEAQRDPQKKMCVCAYGVESLFGLISLYKNIEKCALQEKLGLS